MADIFDVVADPTRRDLLGALLERRASQEAATGEMSVGELVERLGISQPTVSKHLRVLRDHGLVSVREDGQHRYYRLDAAPLESLQAWLVPFLTARTDEEGRAGDGPRAETVGRSVDAGQTLGRTIADGRHQAGTVIRDASEAVQRRLPTIIRRRPFRKG